MKTVVGGAAILILVAPLALAHEARLHRGNPIEGEIVSVQREQEGWSMIVDPAGRVLASALDAGGDDVLLVSDVPIARAGTVYSWAGDWVIGCAAVGLLGLGFAAVRRRYRQAAKVTSGDAVQDKASPAPRSFCRFTAPSDGTHLDRPRTTERTR